MNTVSSLENSLIVCLGNKKYIPCENFKHASDIVTEFIFDNNLGSSVFYSKKDIGIILHPVKGIIANVSYNGRVWKSKGEEITNLNANDIL